MVEARVVAASVVLETDIGVIAIPDDTVALLGPDEENVLFGNGIVDSDAGRTDEVRTVVTPDPVSKMLEVGP